MRVSGDALRVRGCEGTLEKYRHFSRSDKLFGEQNGLGKPARAGESPVCEVKRLRGCVTRVRRDTRNPVGSRGDHPPRLHTRQLPIAHSTVRER